MKRLALRAVAMTVSAFVMVAIIAAAPSSSSALSVTGAYSRPATDIGAVFLTIANTGKSDDTLDDARSDVAGSTEIHETYQVNGGDAMRHVPSLAIPAGQAVIFKSGGYHVMLIGLKHELHVGDKFTIGLHFAHAGWVDVPVVVKSF